VRARVVCRKLRRIGALSWVIPLGMGRRRGAGHHADRENEVPRYRVDAGAWRHCSVGNG
jgi:hypothetical protein